MLVSLTVGKVDAGMAVLLTEDKRIIEFPSILLPPDITSGSIVDITVARNHTLESSTAKQFSALQSQIIQTFGLTSPSPPVLRCRNATQTSVVLEWDPVELATAELRSLSLYRNGVKAGVIPRPQEITSTKISGLAVDTEYTFHLVLKTSAGTYSSEKLNIRTHKMTELHGITVTPGIMPASLRESLAGTIEKIGAKLIDTVRIDTTHFVCTEGRGQAWEKAVEMNIPVVVPDWVKGCEREGRLVGVRGYYLNADPRLRNVGPSVVQANVDANHPMRSPPPTTHVTPPTPERPTRERREESHLGMGSNGGSGENVGRPSASSEPPTPPPKMDGAGGSSTMVDRTSQALQKEMGTAREEDSDSEADGPPPGSSAQGRQASPSPSRSEGKKASVEDDKSSEGGYEDVAL